MNRDQSSNQWNFQTPADGWVCSKILLKHVNLVTPFVAILHASIIVSQLYGTLSSCKSTCEVRCTLYIQGYQGLSALPAFLTA